VTRPGSGHDVVVLFDVDDTLLDNDRVIADLHNFLESEVGAERAAEYFEILEALRDELGYVDYLGALQRYRIAHPHDSHVLAVSPYLIDYPFANRLYPGALDAVRRAGEMGRPVILSDGDVVFQPRKIHRSGLFEEFEGHILVYIHKEEELADVERRYPARRYVLVDDKLRILAAVKDAWGDRVVTVFPRQGHYAHDPAALESYPPADITIDRIGALAELAPETLLGGTGEPAP
jgi:FMN phosphatase YigB (HAD superfamily)